MFLDYCTINAFLTNSRGVVYAKLTTIKPGQLVRCGGASGEIGLIISVNSEKISILWPHKECQDYSVLTDLSNTFYHEDVVV